MGPVRHVDAGVIGGLVNDIGNDVVFDEIAVAFDGQPRGPDFSMSEFFQTLSSPMMWFTSPSV